MLEKRGDRAVFRMIVCAAQNSGTQNKDDRQDGKKKGEDLQYILAPHPEEFPSADHSTIERPAELNIERLSVVWLSVRLPQRKLIAFQEAALELRLCFPNLLQDIGHRLRLLGYPVLQGYEEGQLPESL